MDERNGVVYVLDDEPGVRKALTRLLRLEGFDARPFEDAVAFLEAYRPEETSCLVLDVSMPGLDGLELQHRLKQMGMVIPIVFLTGQGDIPMSVNAIKAGAVDFLTKPVNDAELLKAVGAALNLSALRNTDREHTLELRQHYQCLTPREREVMNLVVAGKLNKQIAAELGTGEQTIKIHRGRVMKKMAVDSLADLVRAAERLGV